MPETDTLKISIEADGCRESFTLKGNHVEVWRHAKESTGLNDTKLFLLMFASLHTRLRTESIGASVILRKKDGTEVPWNLPGDLLTPYESLTLE